MDETTIVLMVVAALVAGVLAVLLLRRGSERDAAAAGQALGERLDHAVKLQIDTIQRVSEALQAQERHVREALDQRLADLHRRLDERLNKGQAETHQTVADLRERLARIDEAQRNISQLSTQVVSLQEILSNKQARGAFGEVQLNDLVSGILPPSAFAFQKTLASGVRVDCLLTLPNPPGPIAIDAKFPLESYHALRAAADDVQRALAQRGFRIAMQKHIGDIADKYIVPGETAESALMFLPAEAVYAELHTNFPDVVEHSYRRRVWIVSPTTLMATLNTVRAVLKDVQMREQAGLIQKEVRLLMEDTARLADRVEALKKHYRQGSEDLDKITTSADKIARRGERIQALELGEAEKLLPPAPASK